MDKLKHCTISIGHLIFATAGSDCGSAICTGGTKDLSFRHVGIANSAASSIATYTKNYFITNLGYVGYDGHTFSGRPQRPAL